MEKKNLYLFAVIAILVLIAAAFIIVYYYKIVMSSLPEPSVAIPAEQTQKNADDSGQKATQNIPDSNPIPSANPLENAKNPFETGYTNPFNK